MTGARAFFDARIRRAILREGSRTRSVRREPLLPTAASVDKLHSSPQSQGLRFSCSAMAWETIAFSSVRGSGIAKPESSTKVRRSDLHRSPELAAIGVLLCQSTAVEPQPPRAMARPMAQRIAGKEPVSWKATRPRHMRNTFDEHEASSQTWAS